MSLPSLAGPQLEGLPADPDGFIPVDLHGLVQGEEDVYAAGDATNSPIKQGGVASQQADAAAEAIAARAGAAVDPQPFRPVLRGLLLTGSTPRYMSAEVSGGRGEDWRVQDHALWWPPSKIAGKRLAPYLALRHDELETEPAGLTVDVEVPDNNCGQSTLSRLGQVPRELWWSDQGQRRSDRCFAWIGAALSRADAPPLSGDRSQRAGQPRARGDGQSRLPVAWSGVHGAGSMPPCRSGCRGIRTRSLEGFVGEFVGLADVPPRSVRRSEIAAAVSRGTSPDCHLPAFNSTVRRALSASLRPRFL